MTGRSRRAFLRAFGVATGAALAIDAGGAAADERERSPAVTTSGRIGTRIESDTAVDPESQPDDGPSSG